MSAILTTNWKDGAYDNRTTSVQNQMMGIILIIAQMGLAFTSSGVGNSATLGALTLAYSGSSFIGYFGYGNSPILNFCRANINAPLLSVSFLISMLLGGFNIGLVALMMTLMYDGFEGMTERTYQTPGDT